MLIGNIDGLRRVNLLDFLEDVFFSSSDTGNLQQFLRSDRSFCHRLSGSHFRAYRDIGENSLSQIALMINGVILIGHCDDHALLVVLLADIRYFAIDLGDNCHTLRRTCFEQLFDTRETLCDIAILIRNTSGMEVTHGQLSTRLADCLCGHDTDCFTRFNRVARCHIAAIALAADALRRFAGEYVADPYLCDTSIDDLLCHLVRDVSIFRADHFASRRIRYRLLRVAAGNTFLELLDDRSVFLIHQLTDQESAFGSAVFFVDDDFLRDIDQTSCQISGLCRLQSGIGKSFTYTMGGNEELGHAHSFTEAGIDRDFNDRRLIFFLGFGLSRTSHETAHSGKLREVVLVAAGTGNRHHVDRVHTRQRSHQRITDLILDLRPEIRELCFPLRTGQETSVTEIVEDICLAAALIHHFLLMRCYGNIRQCNRHTGNRGIQIAHILQGVQNRGSTDRRRINIAIAVLVLCEYCSDQVSEVLLLEFLRNWTALDFLADIRSKLNEIVVRSNLQLIPVKFIHIREIRREYAVEDDLSY